MKQCCKTEHIAKKLINVNKKLVIRILPPERWTSNLATIRRSFCAGNGYYELYKLEFLLNLHEQTR